MISWDVLSFLVFLAVIALIVINDRKKIEGMSSHARIPARFHMPREDPKEKPPMD